MRLDIAAEFSRYPGGRYRKHGKHSGEEFRETLLLPKLRQAIAASDILEVAIDGVRGYGSSFLEEAFGGLIRVHGIPEGVLMQHLRVAMRDPRFRLYAGLIERYIREAGLQKAS